MHDRFHRHVSVISTLLVAALAIPVPAEVIFRETFETAPSTNLFVQTYGDTPTTVERNGVEPTVGYRGTAGGHLRLVFGPESKFNLSYYSYDLHEPVPLLPQLSEISLRIKTNVPVMMKVPIAPFGFIYHPAPVLQASDKWQEIKLTKAYTALSDWCTQRDTWRDPSMAFVNGVIIAVAQTKNVTADIAIDDLSFTGPKGAAAAARKEALKRKWKKIHVSVVSQVWSDEGRTLEAVSELIAEAAHDGADLVSLPQECVKTEGESFPGPTSQAIAAKARQFHLYVLGNLREQDGAKTYVTSFICDREGKIVGKYRKSHKMPEEDIDLGDDLPVFSTDFGKIAVRVGTDRFFPDIDHVYTAKGANMIFWQTLPEPVEDEYSQDFPSEGRAVNYGVFVACSRYQRAEQGWITNMYPPYCGSPIGRAYIINREGERIASTPRKGVGVATATIAWSELGGGRGAPVSPAFKALTAPVQPPAKRQWTKRRIRVTIVESHLDIEDLCKKLDEAGKMGSDIVCLYEYVWIAGPDKKQIEAMTKTAKVNLARVAEKARQWRMYVLIGGVVDRIERNEAIVFGREGQEVGRYFKIAKTHDEQVIGEETPVFETDFGRIAARICADEWMVELDRCYGIKGADILFTPTQSWGPDALLRDQRDISRAMDAGLFLVECTLPSTEVRHRSMIVEPTGVVVARSEYRQNSIVSAVIDLDKDRPLRYLRKYKPHTPVGYLPEYQPTQMPESANDLRDTILAQRRPELYQILAVKPKAAS